MTITTINLQWMFDALDLAFLASLILAAIICVVRPKPPDSDSLWRDVLRNLLTNTLIIEGIITTCLLLEYLILIVCVRV